LGVCAGSPCPEIELSEVEHKAKDCRLGKWRGMRTMKKGMSLVSKDFYGKTRGAISFGTRGIGVIFVKVEVSRNVAGVLGSKSKKWKLVVGGV